MRVQEKPPPAKRSWWNFMLVSEVFIYGSHGLLLNICKINGKIPFSSASVVFFIELTKLLISLLLLMLDVVNGGTIRLPSPTHFLLFSVPAILYSLSNNIVVHIQTYVDPASFQLLGNLKIVCIAVFYRILLKRRVPANKWIAFLLITVAGVCNSYGGWITSQEGANDSEHKIHVTLFGVFLILVFCFISATAGIYTEYILKKEAKLSLPVQSIMLYSFGVGFNFFAFFISQILSFQDDRSDFQGAGEIFKGYSIWTLIIIITQAINGVIMGVVMKHATNLTRLVLIAGAMLVNISLSVILFSLELNNYFVVAFILIMLGMFFYHKPDI